MAFKNTFLTFGIALLVMISGLSAQQAILTSGADASGSGGIVSYSIGQVAYTHFGGENGHISLGVQQPHVVIMVDTDDPGLNVSANLFPNPVSDAVHLEMDPHDFSTIGAGKLAYTLYDIDGKTWRTGILHSPVTIIPVEDLGNALYIIRITHGEVVIKTFKIFKTN